MEKLICYDPMVLWTIVIAAATVVNVGVAVFMWLAMRQSNAIAKKVFEASHRPYIGVSEHIVKINEISDGMYIHVGFKNFGEIPARKVRAKWQVFINGNLQPSQILPDDNIETLFPGTSGGFGGNIGNPQVWASIDNGTSVLEVSFEATYQGITEETYRTNEQARYKPQVRQLVPFKGEWL
jgi:hypothetical protein